MKKTCKVSKRSVQNCKRSCAHKRYPLSIYWGWKITKFTMWKKWQKCSNNYTQTICTSSYHEENTCKVSKRSVQNCKRSCAHKRYPLSIYWGWKITKFTMWKKWQKCSNNYTQTICTSSYHEENTCKVSKRSVQNCKRSCAHKRYPLSIYWGWKMTKFTMWKKWQKYIVI